MGRKKKIKNIGNWILGTKTKLDGKIIDVYKCPKCNKTTEILSSECPHCGNINIKKEG